MLVFWLLIRPPAALSWLPKPPFPPSREAERRSVTRFGVDGSLYEWKEARGLVGSEITPEWVERHS